MNKRVKKIKVRGGRDATRSVLRKLMRGLIINGKINTTLKRARIVKQVADILVHKAIVKTEASKNVLLRYLGQEKLVAKMFEEIGPRFTSRVGGCVRLVKLGPRVGDGAFMARVEWTEPIQTESEKGQAPRGVKEDKDAPAVEKEPGDKKFAKEN